MPEAMVSRILRVPGYGVYACEAEETTGRLWLWVRQTAREPYYVCGGGGISVRDVHSRTERRVRDLPWGAGPGGGGGAGWGGRPGGPGGPRLGHTARDRAPHGQTRAAALGSGAPSDAPALSRGRRDLPRQARQVPDGRQ